MTDGEMGWLAEHRRAARERERQECERFEEYRGRWIAILDGKVIADGKTAVETSRAAEAKANGREFVLEAVDLESDVIYGSA